MKKILFTFFIAAVLSGCSVIGSQPVPSFDAINGDSVLVFLPDSRNAVFFDTSLKKNIGHYSIPSEENLGCCYSYSSHLRFYSAGNHLYFTSENDNENLGNAQRLFYLDYKDGSYTQLPVENFSNIYSFCNRLWVCLDNNCFYEYAPEEKLGIETENSSQKFDGTYFLLDGLYYLRSGSKLFTYGEFQPIDMTSDAEKKMVNALSSSWTAPFYTWSDSDGKIYVDEISSVKPFAVQEVVSYTKESLDGCSIRYIANADDGNTMYIICAGNGKTRVEKFTRNNSGTWNAGLSGVNNNVQLRDSLCKETDSSFWMMAEDANGSQIFLQVEKETLTITEVRE